MVKKFGVAFEKVSAATKGPGSRFMEDFESIKADFREDTDHGEMFELPLWMDLPESESYDADERIVRLTW